MESFEHYVADLQKASRTGYLIAGFIHGQLTIEEEEELDTWIEASDANMDLFLSLTDETRVDDFIKWYSETDVERKLEETKRLIGFGKKARLIKMLGLTAAASVVLLIALGLYFRIGHPEPGNPVAGSDRSDIPPGKANAVLRLSDGQTVLLNAGIDTAIGRYATISNGEVIYGSTEDSSVTHEISIPRKGFYKLTLQDGTRVWLNSESGIQYPSAFGKGERRVTVTGETYFEVAKDASRPFIVNVKGIDVRAVGTAFDINAYPDENELKATLIEGSIMVSRGTRKKLMRQGEQLQINDNSWKLVDDASVLAATSWVRNEFKFKNQSLPEIMRMLARWYDAEVTYEANVDYHFNGTIERDLPLSRVLSLLEKTGHVHFTVKGNMITVKN